MTECSHHITYLNQITKKTPPYKNIYILLIPDRLSVEIVGDITIFSSLRSILIFKFVLRNIFDSNG